MSLVTINKVSRGLYPVLNVLVPGCGGGLSFGGVAAEPQAVYLVGYAEKHDGDDGVKGVVHEEHKEGYRGDDGRDADNDVHVLMPLFQAGG